MVARAGRFSIMAKSDMVAAYKTLAVCIKQRSLQFFKFMGALFLDLRLIFGDRMACMFFDRLHYCIIYFLVRPRAPMPAMAVARAIDDVPLVVPKDAAPAIDTFVAEYRSQLNLLNIGAAENDTHCRKAFDSSTHGEVLGIVFNTASMTWSLPAQKTAALVKLLQRAVVPGSHFSLNDVEVLHGRLVHFAQLARPVSLFADEIICFLKSLLTEYEHSSHLKRDQTSAQLPPELISDCRIIAAIVKDAYSHPLPILVPSSTPPVDAIPVFPDVSGEWDKNASLGIYVPQHGHFQPLVASLRIPFYFLASRDSHGHWATHKTTALESLAFLATLCIEPHRWVDQDIIFFIDNLPATLAMARGRSKKDRWATTAIRAARVVAAALRATIHTEWVPRCSSRGTVVADELSHCRTACLSAPELAAFLAGGHIRFPDPILLWMSDPKPDQSLGHSCLAWIRNYYPDSKYYLT